MLLFSITGSIGHDNCNVLRCYSVVRVYVKVQCGGFVLRLGEERRKRKSVIVISGFKAGTHDTCPIGDGDFFDVAASCRSSLSPDIIHWHFFRHCHFYTSTTSATMTSTKIVIGWLAAPSKDLAGRSPISFHKGRSHSCLTEQFFALFPTLIQLLFIFVSSTLISL